MYGPPYLLAWVFALGVIGYAANWDIKTLTVPNLIWVITLPFALMCVPSHFHVLDLFAAPILVGLLGWLRLKRWMGMGDVKGFAWLMLVVGVPAASLVFLGAAAGQWMRYRPGRRAPRGPVPFMAYAFAAMVPIALGVTVWLSLR